MVIKIKFWVCEANVFFYPILVFADFSVDSVQTLAATAQAPAHNSRQINLKTIVNQNLT